MKIQRLLFILFFFLKLNSGFSQWNIMPTGTTDNLVDICFPSDSIGFSVGYNGIVLKTIDQGNTWNQIANFGGSITSVCNVGRDTIFVGGDRIYRSDDCGNTWDTIISLPFTISDLHFFNSLNGVYINPYTYICGSYIIKNYKIYHSSDAGITWQFKTNYLEPFSQFKIINDSSVYVSSRVELPFGGCSPAPANFSFKTTNRGQSWQSAPGCGYRPQFSFVNDTLSYLMCGVTLNKLVGSSMTQVSNNGPAAKDLVFINEIDGYVLSGNNIHKTNTMGVVWDLDLAHPSVLNKIINDHKKAIFAIGDMGIILKQVIVESLYPDSVFRLTAVPDSLNFNTVTVGGYRTSQVTLANRGNMDINVSVNSSNDFQFCLSDSVYLSGTSFLLSAQQDTVLTVRFTPNDTLTYLDTLIISSANTTDIKIPLQGKGTYDLSGSITGIHTYCADTIRVIGDVSIENNCKITICSGTVVLFMGHYKMAVHGILQAIGLRNDSILFTPQDRTVAWNGIQFLDNTLPDTSILRFCKIEYAHNYGVPSSTYAAGITFVNGGNVILDSSSICYNKGIYMGGGLSVLFGSSAIIRNNKIFNNTCLQYGGGIYLRDCEPLILNNEIYNNKAHDGGGISYFYSNTSFAPQIIQNLIFNNSADHEGGGINCNVGDIHITGNTICNNYAPDNSDGMHCAIYSNSNQKILLNNIIYLNSSNLGNANLQYCDIEGSNFGTGVINADPLFVNPTDSIGFMHNIGTYDWALTFNSPCINMGDSIINSLIPLTDFISNPRYVNNRIDIGAYEHSGVVSVNEIENSGDLKIYPNPFNNSFTVEAGNQVLSELILYDITGKKLKQINLKNSLTIRMEGFENGVYIYEIRTLNGIAGRGRIIKN